MAPRRRTKYKSALNVKQAALGYATLGVATMSAFNLNPVQFVMGSANTGQLRGGLDFASGVTKISLRELFEFDRFKGSSTVSLGEQIGINLKNNAFKMVGGLVSIKIADKLITSMGVSRSFNKGVRAIGLGQLVKM